VPRYASNRCAGSLPCASAPPPTLATASDNTNFSPRLGIDWSPNSKWVIRKFDPSRGTVWGWLAVLTRSRAIDRLRSMGSRRAREVPIEVGFETRSGSPVPEVESIFA